MKFTYLSKKMSTYVNQKRIYHNKSIVILIQIYQADIEYKFKYQVLMNIIHKANSLSNSVSYTEVSYIVADKAKFAQENMTSLFKARSALEKRFILILIQFLEIFF